MVTQKMEAANETYHDFIRLLKWSVPSLAILTLFILIIISD